MVGHSSQITNLIKMGVGTPITRTIRYMQPGLSWAEANRHAWMIYEVAEETGLDWKMLVAVTFQESSFKHFRGDRSCGLTDSGKEACVWKTFGPMHVYYTIWKEKLNLDAQRMLSDLKYGYQVGAKILLSVSTRHKATDAYWVGRYNSKTRKYKEAYAHRVFMHLNRINNKLNQWIHQAQRERLQV